MATIRHSNAPRYDAKGRDTRDTSRSACTAGARVAIQILYRDRKGPTIRLCVAALRQCAPERSCVHRHGRAWPATRLLVLHDTAQRAPRHGAVRAALALCACSLGSGCAPGAPNPVLTQCTVLSHCWGHCSRALFTRFSKIK